LATARTIENIDKGEYEIDEAIARTPNTLHIYHDPINYDYTDYTDSTDGNGEETLTAMDYTDDNSVINTYDGPPELIPRNKDPDIIPPEPRSFAASSATEAEENIAKKGKHADGSTPVNVPKRMWRPKVRMVYEEPEELLDTSGDMDWLFEEHGKVGIEYKKDLPPRDDLIRYNPEVHAKEIDDNIQNGEDVHRNTG
jgi:hypothetical protein